MLDILRLALVFLLIVLLMRKKLGVGWVMLVSSVLLGALYAMPPEAALKAMRTAFFGPTTIEFLSALILIRVLEGILRERDILKSMMDAARLYLKSQRAVIVSMPILIGLLPSVGGAYFSAPMVDEATRSTSMSQEEKGFINFWFRHIWELILPLYPGVLLASAISGLPVRKLAAANLPYVALMLVAGFRGFEGARPPAIKGSNRSGGPHDPPARGLIWSFIPITSVLVLVMALDVKLYLAMGIVIAGLYGFYRYKMRDIVRTMKAGFSVELVVLIAGIMLFKNVMEGSGAVASLSAYFTDMGIPLLPVLFALPFVTGMLTGFTIGFVGATFPLLVSLHGGDTLGAVSFAFMSGYAGVLLSPVHICLVLTREYFNASLWGMYRRFFLPVLLMVALAAVEYFALARLLPFSNMP